MKKQTLEIKVIGKTNTGKSTIAVNLKKYLEKLGFNTVIDDIDLAPNIGNQWESEFVEPARLHHIKEKVNIKIKVEQLSRTA